MNSSRRQGPELGQNLFDYQTAERGENIISKGKQKVRENSRKAAIVESVASAI
jgi:hypothetical protein